LFLDFDIPIFKIEKESKSAAAKKKGGKEQKQDSPRQGMKKESNWNSHERVVQMMQPSINTNEIKKYFSSESKPPLKIRRELTSNKKIEYTLVIGESLPRFILHGEGWEIMQRLVLRACYCNDMKEFNLT
jgi:hypothetical protein